MGPRKWNRQLVYFCAALLLTIMLIMYEVRHSGLTFPAAPASKLRGRSLNEWLAEEIIPIERQLIREERHAPVRNVAHKGAPSKPKNEKVPKPQGIKTDIGPVGHKADLSKNVHHNRLSLDHINESFPLLFDSGNKKKVDKGENAKIETRHSDSSRSRSNVPKQVAMPRVESNSNSGVKIIIHAKYRTGSTFTGEFFIRHRDTAYMFEPLKYGVGPEFIVKDGQRLLWNLLNCRINTNETLRIKASWLSRHVFSQMANQTPGYARREHVPLSKAEEYCKSVHNTAIKTIRIENVWELEGFMESGVKVVHLIRDPRGVMHSRKHLRRVDIRAEAKKYCHDAYDDIQYMLTLPGVKDHLRKLYHIVRYEDLAIQPRKEMEALYNFAGIAPDESLLSWIKSVEAASVAGELSKAGYAFGTARSNPAYTALAWREDIGMDDTHVIQEECQEFMDLVGYKRFESEQLIRNMSISVLDQ